MSRITKVLNLRVVLGDTLACVVAIVFLCMSLLVTGCGSGVASYSAGDPDAVDTYTIQGTIKMDSSDTGSAGSLAFAPHAAQPVAGAEVYLYAVGITGYGSNATLLAHTRTSSAAGSVGTFSFTQSPSATNSVSTSAGVTMYSNIGSTFKCLSYTFSSADGTTQIKKDSLLYVVAVGGDTQDATGSYGNPSSVLVAPVGFCSSPTPLSNLTEVTTTATAFALAPYISPIYPTATIEFQGDNEFPNGTTHTGVTMVAGAVGTGTSYQTQFSPTTCTYAYATPAASLAPCVNGGLTVGGSAASVAVTPMGYTGIANAFSTVANLVSPTTGRAVTSFSQTSGGVTVTGTPESAKLNTIAGILAHCVDSSETAGSSALTTACSSVFGYAAPPISSATTSLGAGITFPAATDIFQAAYYMATNPTDNKSYGVATSGSTSNLGSLYSLVSSTSYQPQLTAQPTDWTLSIAYTSSNTCGTDPTPGAFLSKSPYAAASDIAGNIYVVNGLSTAGDTLISLTPSGVPATCVLGGYEDGKSIALDTGGGVWVSGNATSPLSAIYKLANGGSTPVSWPPTENGTTILKPYAIVATGEGDVIYNSNASGDHIDIFTGAAKTNTPSNATLMFLAGTSTTSYTNDFLAIDDSTYQGLWMTAWGTNAAPSTVSFTAARGTTSTYAASSTTEPTDIYGAQGIAIDSKNDGFAANNCCSSVNGNLGSTVVKYVGNNGSGAAFAVTGTPSIPGAGGLNGGRGLAVDGAGNVWVANGFASKSYTASDGVSTFGEWSIVELDNNLNPLSPNGSTSNCAALGSTINVNTACDSGGGYQKLTLGLSYGPVVDISGNVWVPTDLSNNVNSSSVVTPGSVVELIGAAVPTVQPLAVALRDNKVGTKP